MGAKKTTVVALITSKAKYIAKYRKTGLFGQVLVCFYTVHIAFLGKLIFLKLLCIWCPVGSRLLKYDSLSSTHMGEKHCEVPKEMLNWIYFSSTLKSLLHQYMHGLSLLWHIELRKLISKNTHIGFIKLSSY